MLELIISKSVEDNFIALAGHGQTDLANRRGLIRRLSVHYIDQELASVLVNEDLSHVRSLTVTQHQLASNTCLVLLSLKLCVCLIFKDVKVCKNMI